MGADEKKDLTPSLIIGFFTVFTLWLIKWIEIKLDLHFSELGIFPRTFAGFKGILCSPFLHGDISHLVNNSISVFILCALLHYFYTPVFFRVLLLSTLITGLGVWFFARPVFHIGASGVIYALAGFIFLSGIIKKHPQLIAISLLISFLYGGIIWGILPLQDKVSWESHLSGLITGLFLAIVYRKYGPIRKKYDWELENEIEDENEDQDEMIDVKYNYKE